MSQSKIAIGSVGYWGAMRFAQFFTICVGVLFLIVGARAFQWQLALILILWFLFAAYLDSCVYGFADEDGVHFSDTFRCSLFRGQKYVAYPGSEKTFYRFT